MTDELFPPSSSGPPDARTPESMALDVLDRVLAGELSPEQGADAAGVSATTLDALRIRLIEADSATSVVSPLAQRADALMARVYSETSVVSSSRVLTSPAARTRSVAQERPFSRARSIVLPLFLAAGAIVAFFGYSGLHDQRTPAREYTTRPGQRMSVTLADASVRLGPATHIRITHVTPVMTTVSVSGEALFSVRPDARRAFTVITEGATARVLGTTFLVRQDALERGTRIVVHDGRVAVARRHHRGDGTALVLSAGTAATVSDSNAVRVVNNVSLDDYTALSAGHLVFRGAAVPRVLAELSRVYGVECRLADSTFTREALTITIPVNRTSVETALDMVVDALDAHYVRSQGRITVLPGRVGERRPHGPPPSLKLPLPETQYGR
jgi:transmembrane sensor